MNRIALVVTATALAVGCSQSQPLGVACTPDMRLGLGIVVMNEQTGAHLCDATVVARSGTYSETLVRQHDARVSSCLYVGALERAGTYSIAAVAAGFSPRTLGSLTVALEKNSCHVEQAIATIRLVPTE